MYGKTEVKPFIGINEKEIIYKIKFITKLSVNSICEDLCLDAINNGAILDFSRHFRRPIKIGDDYFEANTNPLPLEKKRKAVKTERISLQLDNSIYEIAYSIAFAMNCSVAKAVALLLEKTLYDNKKFITQYIGDFITEKFDNEEHYDLTRIIDSINERSLEENHQYDHEEILTALLFVIFDKVKRPDEDVENAVLQFASHWL